MKRSSIKYTVACLASAALALTVHAASSSGSSGQSSSPGDASSGSYSAGAGSSGSDASLSGSASGSSRDLSDAGSSDLTATGRSSSGSQAVRGSTLMGSQVKDTSGRTIGSIEDVILNPTSGRVEFAVISLSARGGATSSSGMTSGSSTSQPGDGTAGAHTQNQGTGQGMNQGTTYEQGGTVPQASTTYGSPGGSVAGSSSGKLIPVPWTLLQSKAGSTSTSSSSGTAGTAGLSGGQQSFTLSVDSSKLQSAPSLSRGNWSEISQSGWSQRIHSYYGVSADTSSSGSTGGAESPYGSGSGSDSLRGSGSNR